MNESELAREYFRLTPKDVVNPKLKFQHQRSEPDVVLVIYGHEDETSLKRYPYMRMLGTLRLSNAGLIVKCIPNDDGPYELVDRLMQAYGTAPQEA